MLRANVADFAEEVEFTTKGLHAPPKLLVTSVTLDTATVYISDVQAQGQMIFYLNRGGDVSVHVHDGSKTKVLRNLTHDTNYEIYCKVLNYRGSMSA